jgi:chemotaxis protein MotA
LSNCVFTPLANALSEKTKKEMLIKNIMIEGIMSIVAGDNPRIVEQKLAACLDPINRTKVIKQR